MSRFPLEVVARTGELFRSFAPYVASIDDDGRVAFQATLEGGRTGVFRAALGAPCERLLEHDELAYSHPDLEPRGVVVYARTPAGERLLRVEEGRRVSLADTSRMFSRIGPLGPTANARGLVAFRADTRSGAGVYLASSEGTVPIADASRFARFHGLPLVTDAGLVVFRADRRDGARGIYAGTGSGQLETIIETRGELGPFPCADASGATTFVGGPEGGVFVARGGRVERVVDTSSGFESVRGSLLDQETLVFFATPRGGPLGVYAGPDPVTDRIVGLGDPAFGSVIVDLALNPVSIAAGRLAVRLALGDRSERVVRVELGASR